MLKTNLNFNKYAVVFDRGTFLHWKVAELYKITERSSWFKSDLFDMWKVYEQLTNCMQEDLECASPELRRKIEEIYDKLEEARRPIRLKIWNYHKQKKPNYDTAKDDFDSIRVTSSRYEMESLMEPLFYCASIRDYSMAKEA